MKSGKPQIHNLPMRLHLFQNLCDDWLAHRVSCDRNPASQDDHLRTRRQLHEYQYNHPASCRRRFKGSPNCVAEMRQVYQQGPGSRGKSAERSRSL